MTDVRFLGVTEEHEVEDFRSCRGAYFFLPWLWDMCGDIIHQNDEPLMLDILMMDILMLMLGFLLMTFNPCR